MLVDAATAVGLLAGAITSLSVVPQVYGIWKKRAAKDVSYRMFAALSVGAALWILFGCLKGELAIILSNSVSLILNLSVIFLKWKYRGNS
ncbi:MAG: SemiSWEET transporter [Bdellovibrionaceae bacterium]|nr:SemiSWEET transporter [Pseudobdellovibrionaceae bacterium]